MSTLSFVAHVVIFALSALICLASIPQARKIQHRGTRDGFVVLLFTVGVWAIGYVGYLVAPLDSVRLAFYLLGISSAFVSVGAFLYLCAAYTGRPPRQMPYRRVAAGIFLFTVLLKLTNPLHHLFFTTTWASDPFPHLAVQHNPLYWIFLGLSYAVIAVGFFMLFERLYHTGTDTRPLVVLLGLTGLPAGVTILAEQIPALLPLMYEPPGVAIFAVGTLFVYFRQFETVQLTSGTEAPAIFLDQDERIRDYNHAAVELLPTLQGSLGESVHSVIPRVVDALAETTEFIEIENEAGPRVYQVSSSPFLSGEVATGQLITLTDITQRERYRRELEQTNERLEEFANVISHDLRNPLNVAQGRVDLARTECDSEHLDHVVRAHTRIEVLIDDLLTLAREGEQVGELEAVAVRELIETCWQTVETAQATIVIQIDRTIQADRSRVQQLFENLIRNAIEHGGADVTVTVGELADGFYVEDDGPGIPEDDRDGVFDAGYSTAEDGTGFGLSIVTQVADAHGWDIRATEGTDGGARFEIRGVEFVD
ncbi:integral membrane sensor signal transduction histidine kinase [Halogeometricum pallidum JCM 14848]|uniref:histidine kinase n=1 Tax=Halogeometricum pallidum JCM 14848 TaxID=1227487 RepID=M0CYV9_HALPD|nr:ATP-binding protein [Halogeometricum pallidum]ELZ27059.1 integral membrane sensor signal transduction histidine kinase [Halogeometricum pallidum JCM 14848]